MDSRIKSEIKEKKQVEVINFINEIYRLGTAYWTNLLNEGMKRYLLSPMEVDLLKLAIACTKGLRVPSDRQAKTIWKIREKLDQAGVLV